MTEEIVVFSEKVRRPSSRGLIRERLLQPLLADDGPGTRLVVALAGSGKTTLMAQAADRLGAASGWYRTTADDATPAALIAHVSRALGLPKGTPSETVDDVLVAIEQTTEPRTLFVDDLHEIKGTVAERTLERFLELRPPWVRVVLGSRSAPLFNLPRLRVSETIREVSGEDLRFRSWEVEQLLRDNGIPLPPEVVAALTRKVAGWAAGLQFFQLATAQMSAAARCQAVTALDGRSAIIKSYLARNVVEDLGDDLYHFLTRTCTLGLITAPLCDALLDGSHSAEILTELEERQLFTSSADGGLSYRYHQVLQLHLELALLDELGPKQTRALYGRSAALLEAVGVEYEALRAYARAEDWGSVARLAHANPESSGLAAPSWDLSIPRHLRDQDPWCALADARRELRRGRIVSAVDAYRYAETLFDEADVQSRCASERRLAALWSGRLSSRPTPDGSRHPGHWTARVRAAVARIRPDPGRAPGAAVGDLIADGVCALLSGDVGSARESFEAACTGSDAGSFERCVALLGRAVTLLLGPTPGAARRLLDEAILSADFEGYEWLARIGGSIQRAVEPRVRSGHEIPTGVSGDANDGDPWGTALCALVDGLAAESQSQPGTDVLVDAAGRLAALDAGVLEAWALSAAAAGAARRGDPAAAGLAARAKPSARRSGAPGPLLVASVAEQVARTWPGDIELDTETRELLDESGIDSRLLIPQRLPTSASATALEVTCLGGFRLASSGEPVDVSGLRPRARALLRLLAISAGRDLHRELIAELLWPGVSSGSATRSLQVAISSIRQAFESAGLPGQELVVRSGDAYRLELPAGSTSDVAELERAVRKAADLCLSGDLATAISTRGRAVSLYGGDLLPEDGPAEWVVAERERIRLLAAGAALAQARDLRDVGDLNEAIALAARSVQIYRFGDEAWELLAALNDDAGNVAAALRTRLEHAHVIDELSGPDEETISRTQPRRRPGSRGEHVPA